MRRLSAILAFSLFFCGVRGFAQDRGFKNLYSATALLDTTTGTLLVNITQQWGTASALNTFTIDQCTIEVL